VVVLVRLVGSGLSPHTTDARRARGEELTGEPSRYRTSALLHARFNGVLPVARVRFRLDVALTMQHETVDREGGLMKGKRQTTRAKMARERLVQERRALKREKKQAAAAARDEAAAAHGAETVVDGTVPMAINE
jgi:hypothetical protein